MKEKQKRVRLGKDHKHYVNNKEFTQALRLYSSKARECDALGKEKPRMNDYLGISFIKIAERLSMRPNFRGYMYRDEMVQDAILAACKYAHKFDGDRFDNAFAYITQVMFSHMVQRIKKEKRKYTLDLKMIQQGETQILLSPDFENPNSELSRQYADQRLGELEEAKVEKKVGTHSKAGFTLRSHVKRNEAEIEAIQNGIEKFEVDGKHFTVREDKRTEYLASDEYKEWLSMMGHNGGPKLSN